MSEKNFLNHDYFRINEPTSNILSGYLTSDNFWFKTDVISLRYIQSDKCPEIHILLNLLTKNEIWDDFYF